MKEEHPGKVLKQLEQRARRRFGQHFLWRQDIVARIVMAAKVRPEDRVLEVGPGLGVLSRALLAAGADLTAVELDRDLAQWLREHLPQIRLVEGDALRVDWREVCPGSGWRVVANLPYNVGTQLVLGLLDHPATFDTVTVMLQKEVVDRMLASPGNKTYGALTLQIGARAIGRFIVKVPPTAFHPKPKVESSVVQFELRAEPAAGPAGLPAFERVVRAAFSQRRKIIANSLGSLYGKEVVVVALDALGLDPGLRAEALGAAAFRDIAAALHPLDRTIQR